MSKINPQTYYGKCECGADLEARWFIEKERKNNLPTGRQRKAVDALCCPICLREYPIDDSFDEPWYYPKGPILEPTERVHMRTNAIEYFGGK